VYRGKPYAEPGWLGNGKNRSREYFFLVIDAGWEAKQGIAASKEVESVVLSEIPA